MALPIGLLVTVLVLAGGGLAVAAGARYVVGRITGDQEGTDRLVSAKSVTGQGRHADRVGSSSTPRASPGSPTMASNDRPTSITLPLFQNCTLRGADGTTLQAN